MSRQVRQRVTAVLLCGLLLGAPLLANDMANATPIPLPAHGSAIPDSDIKVKTTIMRGTGRSAPISERKSPPVRHPSARSVPTLDLLSPTESAPAAPGRPGPDIAAEPVAATSPMSENGLLGLLAAVSIVLVIGVSAGLIRAIVSERASRTKIA